MVQVTLGFPIDDDEFEGSLDSVDVLPREVIEDPSLLSASLCLRAPDGTLELSDEALALIPALSALALVDLLRDGTATAAMWSWRGRVNLDLEGDQVRLSGDGVPDLRVPLVSLAEGMISMSLSFAALLTRSGLAPEVSSKLERACAVAELLLDAPRPEVDGLPPLSGRAAAPLRGINGDQLSVTLSVVDGPPRPTLRLWLSSPAGEAERVEPLEPLLDQVFLQGLRRLSAGRHVRYAFLSGYGYLRLFHDGAALRICGDGIPDISVPLGDGLRTLFRAADELIRALPSEAWRESRVTALDATRTALVLTRVLDAPVPARVLEVLRQDPTEATVRCELGGQEFTAQVEGAPQEGETCWAHLEVVPDCPIEAGPGGALQLTQAADGRTRVSAILNNRSSLRLLAGVPLYIGGGASVSAAFTAGRGLIVEGTLRLVCAETDPAFAGREVEAMQIIHSES